MKKNLLRSIHSMIFITLSLFAYSQTGGVSINKTNTPADASAMLDVSSTSTPYMGMLIPRMSTANRNAIVLPATGLQIFNTDCGVNEYYTGTCWISTGQNLRTPDPITCSGTTDFCANESRTFTIPTVTGATSYQWTVPAGASITSGQGTTSATVLFGNHSGDVCVTAGNLCEVSPNRCINVYINPVPSTPGYITGPTIVAPGATATYFIASVAGAGVYNWTVPSGATITSGVGTTTITVNFSCSAISGNITVAAQSNCGTSSGTNLAITMSPLSANAGPSISGQGTIGGSPTASGGTTPYTYAWLPSANLSSASVANPASTVCSTTTYTVTVTDANGCTARSSTTVSNPILQLPSTSASPNPICAGNALTLSTSSVPGAAYSWTGPNAFASTSQSPTINNVQTNQSGSYTVTATVSGCSATSSVNVTVNSVPASTFTPVSGSINAPINFSPTVTGATYGWTFSSGTPSSSTVQNPSVTWSAGGTYNVSLTVTQNGCSSSTTNIVTINAILANCQAILTAIPGSPDGVYTIDPDGTGPNAPYSAYCDMTSAGGGWTLVGKNDYQSRANATTTTVNGWPLTSYSVADNSTATGKLDDATTNTIAVSKQVRLFAPATSKFIQFTYSGSYNYTWNMGVSGLTSSFFTTWSGTVDQATDGWFLRGGPSDGQVVGMGAGHGYCGGTSTNNGPGTQTNINTCNGTNQTWYRFLWFVR